MSGFCLRNESLQLSGHFKFFRETFKPQSKKTHGKLEGFFSKNHTKKTLGVKNLQKKSKFPRAICFFGGVFLSIHPRRHPQLFEYCRSDVNFQPQAEPLPNYGAHPVFTQV